MYHASDHPEWWIHPLRRENHKSSVSKLESPMSTPRLCALIRLLILYCTSAQKCLFRLLSHASNHLSPKMSSACCIGSPVRGAWQQPTRSVGQATLPVPSDSASQKRPPLGTTDTVGQAASPAIMDSVAQEGAALGTTNKTTPLFPAHKKTGADSGCNYIWCCLAKKRRNRYATH